MPRLSHRDCLDLGLALAGFERAADALEDARYNQNATRANEASSILSHHGGGIVAHLSSMEPEVLEVRASARRLIDRPEKERRLDSDPVVEWHDATGEAISTIWKSAKRWCAEGAEKGKPKEWMPREMRG